MDNRYIKRIIKVNKFELLFVIISFCILLYRITIHADTYDEIININIAYRVALGQKPFYEALEAFQSGDILIAPFIWLYIKILGKTSGIVLFSRFLYLLFMVLSGITVFMVAKRFLSTKRAFFLGYICLFFQLYGLYYLWYDTISLILLLIGSFLGFGVATKAIDKKWLILSGFLHGLMAFAYPSYLLIVVIFSAILLIHNIKSHSYTILFYILGGSIVILLFILLIYFHIGFDNFLYGINFITSYRSSNVQSQTDILKDIITSFITVNHLLIFPTLLLIYIFFKSLSNKNYIALLVYGILFFSFLNSIMINSENRGIANYTAYIALWAPFLFFLVKKNKNHFKNMMVFVWCPAIASCISITLLTVYSDIGPLKSWQAFFPGCLVSLSIMSTLLLENPKHQIFEYLDINKIVIICLIVGFYNYIYLNQPMIRFEDRRMPEGIYKGIKVNDDMLCWKEIQNLVNYYTEGKKSILASGNLRAIYLMTGLFPITPSVESPNYYKDNILQWDISLDYFSHFKTYPEIMFLSPYDLENTDFKKIIKEKYTFISEEYIEPYEILIYELD